MENINDTTRCYPRTLEQAFPSSPEYAQAIEHYPHGGSGLFEFILVIIGLGMLAVAIGIFL
jgi:hypothetical protein